MAEQFPQLKALIETRHPKSNKGRMIIVGVLVLFGIVAAASRTGKFTVPFMILVLVVIFFFKRFERFFSGSETAWRHFRDTAEGTVIDAQLPQLESELTGETIEWSQVMITDNFLLWPKEIEGARITAIADISLIYFSDDATSLLCDTDHIGNRLLITSDLAEVPEIVNELLSRSTDLRVDPKVIVAVNQADVASDDEETSL